MKDSEIVEVEGCKMTWAEARTLAERKGEDLIDVSILSEDFPRIILSGRDAARARRQGEAVKAFLADIRAVYEKHRMVLTASDYDVAQVWPLTEERDVEWTMEASDCTQKNQNI